MVQLGKMSQAEADKALAKWRKERSATDKLLQDLVDATSKQPERFVAYNNQVIDLEHVRWLDEFQEGKGCWVILDCTIWNIEGDYWDNAPYIQSDVAEAFKQEWIKYFENKRVQGN